MSSQAVKSEKPPPRDRVSADGVNKGFTAGGDLTMRSTDGVDFSVHSLFLSVASPVFSDLLKANDNGEIVHFSERSELLALMLNFIYPRATPTISSIDLLKDALRVADKYQLDNMKNRLREQFAPVDSPVSVYTYPFDAFRVAYAHGFTAEAELAVRVASKQCDFGTGQGLKKLVDAAPDSVTATLVGLIGIPLVKTRVLVDVLFQFGRAPMRLTSVDALTCDYCREIHKVPRQSPPEWQARWARWIFDELKDRPIADWKSYFDHANSGKSFYHSNLPVVFIVFKYDRAQPNCQCISKVDSAAAAFQPWANGVYEYLKSQLVVVAELEGSVRDPGPEGGKE